MIYITAADNTRGPGRARINWGDTFTVTSLASQF